MQRNLECCGILFANKEKRRDHTLIHKSKHICQICQDVYVKQEDLELHMVDCKFGNFNECEKCLKRFQKKDDYLRHLLTHSKNVQYFDCTPCGLQFPDKELLSRHIEYVHMEQEEQVDDTMYICVHCGQKICSRANWTLHMILHTNSGHACNTCDKQFLSANQLHKHMEIHEKEQCQIILEIMKNKDKKKLQRKRGLVYEEPKMRCSLCSKQFSRSRHLRLHMECHTMLECCCKKCKNMYYLRKTLRKHLLIHSKRTKGCGYCKKVTQALDGMEHHIHGHFKLSDKTRKKVLVSLQDLAKYYYVTKEVLEGPIPGTIMNEEMGEILEEVEEENDTVEDESGILLPVDDMQHFADFAFQAENEGKDIERKFMEVNVECIEIKDEYIDYDENME